MIYVNDAYSDYKYLVSVSDNYFVLTNQHQVNADWQSPKTIDVIYQYIDSPFTVIESERSFNSSNTFSAIDISSDIMDSPAYPNFVICVIVVVMFILYILNAITKIAKKGGLFFGS